MYKNRYFKTTFGVPTELAFGGNTLPTGNTQQDTLEFPALTGVAGVIYPIRHVFNPGATTATAVATGSTITATTGLFTVGTVTSGNFVVGMTLTGGSIGSNVVLTSLVSGTGGTGSTFNTSTGTAQTSTTVTGTGITAGGHKRYVLKNSQAWNNYGTADPATFTATFSTTTMTVTSVISGTLAAGMVITGTALLATTAGTQIIIVSQATGATGGVGTYTVTSVASGGTGILTATPLGALTVNQFVTANQNSQTIQFASCTVAGAAGTGQYNMTTPLVANTIRIIEAQPYQAAQAQVSTLLLNGTYTVGQNAIIKIIETTPGNQNLPTWDYEVPIVTGTTAANLATDFNTKYGTGSTTPTAASTVMTTTRTDEWFYFSISSATITVTAAAGALGRSFKIAFTVQTTSAYPTVSAWTTPTYGVTTAPKWGYGTADQVANLIMEDATRRGVGHYYPQQSALASEFGTPDAAELALISTTPTVITMTGLKYEASPTPNEQHVNPNHYITVVCGPAQAASIVAQFPTL